MAPLAKNSPSELPAPLKNVDDLMVKHVRAQRHGRAQTGHARS